MKSTRLANLRKINLAIGAILTIAGIAGGFLLTFWFLMILLPVTCVGASWVMASSVRPGQEAHVVGATVLSSLLLVWMWYFLHHGAGMLVWYGIALIWSLMMIQALIYLWTKPRQVEPAEIERSP